MDRWTRFSVLCLLGLSLTVGFETWQTVAVPAPSINCIVEPGAGCGPVTGSWVFYKDGSTYLAASGTGGGNTYSGTVATTVIQIVLNTLPTGGSGGTLLFFKAASYSLATALSIPDARIIFRGEMTGTAFSCTLDCFNLSGVQVNFLTFEDFFATSTGGDIFDFGSTKILNSVFRNLDLACSVNGFSCFKNTNTGGYLFNQITSVTMTGSLTNTVPLIILVDNNAGGVNENTFGPRLEISNSGTFAIKIEEQNAGTHAYGNHFIDISCDPTAGGCLGLYSVEDTVIEMVNVYDTSSPTNPMILISKTGANSHNNEIRSVYSRAGTSVKQDIQLDPAVAPSGAYIINPDVGFLDIGNTPGVLVALSNTATTVTIQNIAVDTIVFQDGRFFNRGFILSGYPNAAVNSATTTYLSPDSTGTSGTETSVQMISPVNATVALFYIKISANTLNGATTVTYRKNAGATAITLSITAGSTGTFGDLIHTFTIKASDLLDVQIVTAGSSGSITIQTFSVAVQ